MWGSRARRARREGEETSVLIALPDRTGDDTDWVTAHEVAQATRLRPRRSGAAIRRLIAAGRVETRPHPTVPVIHQFRYSGGWGDD